MTVCENSTQAGLSFFEVTATDVDSPPNNNRIRFSINDTVGSFVIDANTGSISFTGQIDYEDTKLVTIRVRATDTGIPPLSSETYVALEICDSNDNVPIFSESSYTKEISELTSPPSVVFTLIVSDADSGRNGEFEIFITQAFPTACEVSYTMTHVHRKPSDLVI